MLKILIVDDSATETQLLTHLIESAPDLKVIATAKNGKEAVEMAGRLQIDLITMDLNMPVMDGHTATRLIMEQHPVPIVVISSRLKDSSIDMTYLALEAGAVSVIPKPVLKEITNIEKYKKMLVDTIRSMAEIKVFKRRFTQHGKDKLQSLPNNQPEMKGLEIIGIGTSIGGPQALKLILSQLPANFSVPIVIVQHITNGFLEGFIHWLNNATHLKVKMAEDGEEMIAGFVYFAADNCHLCIERSGKKMVARLTKTDPVSGFRPSITVLMQSLAKTCGKSCLGILLTGMGNDGAKGLVDIKQAHGHTIIQDEKSCVVFGIGRVAQQHNAVDNIIELNQIADYLIKITTK